jgi:hypothetical protein
MKIIELGFWLLAGGIVLIMMINVGRSVLLPIDTPIPVCSVLTTCHDGARLSPGLRDGQNVTACFADFSAFATYVDEHHVTICRSPGAEKP